MYECTVVIKPSTIPNSLCTTLANGAKQFVVHEALLRILIDGSYDCSFTPTTNIGASADGAVMTTFLAPPFKWAWHLSIVVNTPVASTTYSAPDAPHGMFCGSFLLALRNYKI